MKQFNLFLLMVGTLCSGLLAQAPGYIEIVNPSAVLRDAPSPSASILYRTSKGTLFSHSAEESGFIQVQLLTQENAWVLKSDTKIHRNHTSPDISRIGLILPYSEEANTTYPAPLVSSTNIRAPLSSSTSTQNTTPSTENVLISTSNAQQENASSRNSGPNENMSNQPLEKGTYLSLPVSSLFKLPKQTVIPEKPRVPAYLNSKVYNYTSIEPYFFPRKYEKKYPDIEIDGFYEGKISYRDYNPKSVTSSVWETIRRDPYYTKLPQDVLVGPPQFKYRYQFQIDGEVGEDLFVHYDIEKEPDLPGKYDIEVDYKNSNLKFFHFDTEFKNGEFTNVKRALNGAQASTFTDEWEAKVAIGEQRSDPKKFETFGNGNKVYKLGNKHILKGSVIVWVNNGQLVEDRDYTINYFQGEITFEKSKDVTDFIKVVYEFTNPIEDFIPGSNRKNFLGGQFKWRSKATAVETLLVSAKSEVLWPTTSSRNIDTGNEIIRFPLKSTYIARNSEIVKLNNRILIRNKHYFMKYKDGQLSLQNINLKASDTLAISYNEYQRSEYEHIILGKNSPGPYQFQHKNVVEQSEIVRIDDTTYARGSDYDINYEKGEITFKTLIKYPRIIDVSYKALISRTTTSDAKDSPFYAGITYLTEYVNAETQELFEDKSLTNQPITSNIFFVNAPFTPLTNTRDIVIKLTSGNSKVTVNHTVLNNYSGKISIPSFDQSKHSKLDINVRYRKSFRSQYTFNPTDGYEDFYRNNETYLQDGTLFQLNDVPVRFNGVEKVTVFDRNQNQEVELEIGSEVQIAYGKEGDKENGIDVRVRFIPNSENTASRLGSSIMYPDSRSPVTLHYQYSPQAAPDEGSLNQTQIGLTAGTKIGKNWSIDAELAGTYHNFSRPRITATANFTGTGRIDSNYNLPQSDIVEDTEIIFLSDGITSKLQRKNSDYFINYKTGSIRFLKLPAPDSNSQIDVTYEYFDNSGSTVAGKNSPINAAARVKTEYRSEKLDWDASLKVIDKNFKPLSPIRDKTGSVILETNSTYRITPQNQVSVSLQRDKEFKGQNDEFEDIFLHTTDIETKGEFLLFDDVNMDHTVRFNQKLQDPKSTNPSTNRHEIDEATLAYNGSISFGPSDLRSTAKRGFSKSITNYVNGDESKVTRVEDMAVESNASARELFLLGDINVRPRYREIETSVEHPGTQNAFELKKELGVDLKITPTTYFRTEFEFDRNSVRTKLQQNDTATNLTFSNDVYRAYYDPFRWISTSYEQKHIENTSDVSGKKGLIEDSTTYRVNRFKPYDALIDVGSNKDDIYMKPLKNAYLTYNNTATRGTEDSGRRQNSRDWTSLSAHSFQILEGINLKLWRFEEEKNNNNDSIETSTVSKNIYTRDYSKQSINFEVNKPHELLNAFTYSLNYSDKSEFKRSYRFATATTSNLSIDNIPQFTRTQTLGFDPGPVRFGGINFGDFKMTVKENWEDFSNDRRNIAIPSGSVTTSQFNSSFSDFGLGTSTFRQDNVFKQSYGIDAISKPFYLFTLEASVTSGNERYSRNINPSVVEGTTIKNKLDGEVKASFAPFSFLNMTAGYSRNRVSQYQSPSINMSISDIIRARDQNSPRFKDFLHKVDQKTNISAVITPFNLLSINTKLEQTQIQQTFANPTANVSSFLQQSGTIGTTLRPVKDLDMTFNYTLKNTQENGLQKGSGNSVYTNINYSPIKEDNFEVKFTYTRTDTWGIDFNTLDAELQNEGTGQTIQTTVSEQQNTVETGSLNLDITIPLTNSPYVEKFVISGEAFIKKITDKKDNERPDSQQNSYEIVGATVKGTLHF
jgi:hypothetical protein